MRANRIATMGLLASLLGLFGCGESPTSQVTFSSGSDVGLILQAASAEGPVGVDVMGDAYGLQPAEAARKIAATLTANLPYPWLKLEPDLEKTDGQYRLVYVFDARLVRDLDFPSICAGRAPRYERDPARINVHAVLCTPRGPVVAVRGWMKRPNSFEDPAMGRLLVQMGFQAVRGAT